MTPDHLEAKTAIRCPPSPRFAASQLARRSPPSGFAAGGTSPPKLAVALLIGLSATLACVAAATTTEPPDIHPLTAPGPVITGDPGSGAPPEIGNATATGTQASDSGVADAPAVDGAGPSDSADGGAAPDGAAPSAEAGAPASDAGAPDAADASPPDASPPEPLPPPLVEMKTPKIENGEVPKAEKALSSTKLLDAIAKCVGDAGGLTAKTGSLKVELLVRARGKAEGVEVTPTGTSQDAAKCVRTLFKNRTIGTPTADPVGVTVVYSLKPAKSP